MYWCARFKKLEQIKGCLQDECRLARDHPLCSPVAGYDNHIGLRNTPRQCYSVTEHSKTKVGGGGGLDKTV